MIADLPTHYHASFTWTEAVWRNAHWRDWIDRSGAFRWGCYATGGVGIACGVLDLTILGSPLWYLYLLVGVPLLVFAPFQWRVAVGRSYDRIPERNRRAEWSFDHDRGSCRIEGVMEALFHWRMFERCLETPEGYLLYQTGGQVFHWLPRAAFATEAQAEHFGRFAAGRIMDARAMTLVEREPEPSDSTPALDGRDHLGAPDRGMPEDEGRPDRNRGAGREDATTRSDGSESEVLGRPERGSPVS